MSYYMPDSIKFEFDGIEMVCVDFSESIRQDVHEIHTLGTGGTNFLDTGMVEHEVDFCVRVSSANSLTPNISGDHELRITRGDQVITHSVVITSVQFNMQGFDGLSARVGARVLNTVETKLYSPFWPDAGIEDEERPEPDGHSDLRLNDLVEWDE